MKRKWIHEEFVEWVKNNRPDYEVVGIYSGNNIKIELKHLLCGNPYFTKPGNFKHGYGCSYCGRTKKVIHEQFIKWSAFNRSDYRIVGIYYRMNTKIDIIHISCNTLFSMKPYHFKQGHGCPKCFGRHKLTQEQFVEWTKLNRPEYKVKGEYVKNDVKIELIHTICGQSYFVRPNDFKYGKRCKCQRNISKFEKEIFSIVKLYYPDAQSNVKGILPNKKLELDIYIPSLDKAIEPSGENWHSSPEVIRRDIQKVEQCKELGIDLLIIWYKKDWGKNKKVAIKKCLTFLSQ